MQWVQVLAGVLRWNVILIICWSVDLFIWLATAGGWLITDVWSIMEQWSPAPLPSPRSLVQNIFVHNWHHATDAREGKWGEGRGLRHSILAMPLCQRLIDLLSVVRVRTMSCVVFVFTLIDLSCAWNAVSNRLLLYFLTAFFITCTFKGQLMMIAVVCGTIMCILRIKSAPWKYAYSNR